MNEQEFLAFFKKTCEEGSQKSYDKISEDVIAKMGDLLFEGNIQHKTKEIIIMTLAHQPSETALAILTKYNFSPDSELKFFAKFALEECTWWNE